MSEPAYKVERDDANQCKVCERGASWWIIGPDDIALGIAFSEREDAEELADNMSVAYTAGEQHGRAAERAAIVAMLKNPSIELLHALDVRDYSKNSRDENTALTLLALADHLARQTVAESGR